jgi:hypothetical protein
MADKKVESARNGKPLRYAQRNLQVLKNRAAAMAALEAAAKRAQSQTPKK